MTSPPKPPKGLQTGGKALWTATLGRYELAEHETTLLVEACRTVDLLDALQTLIDQDGPVLPWGDGTRAHPAVVEARAHRIVLARLVASLGIPAEDEGRVAPRGQARGVYRMGITG
jgi:hypothetical protein